MITGSRSSQPARTAEFRGAGSRGSCQQYGDDAGEDQAVEGSCAADGCDPDAHVADFAQLQDVGARQHAENEEQQQVEWRHIKGISAEAGRPCSTRVPVHP